jgi:hypothetical protein
MDKESILGDLIAGISLLALTYIITVVLFSL